MTSVRVASLLIALSSIAKVKGGMKQCHDALLTHSAAASDLLSCTLTNTFPSDVCIACTYHYLRTFDSYNSMSSVQYEENVTCLEMFLHTEKFLDTGAYILKRSFQFATDQEGAVSKARCSSCYVDSDIRAASLRREVKKYIALYDDTRQCFAEHEDAPRPSNGSHPLCEECTKTFERTQGYLESAILLNKTSYGAFLDICLDVSDRAQELNYIYDKFSCRLEQKVYLSEGSAVALGVVICFVVTISHIPMVVFKVSKKVSRFRGAVYTKSRFDSGPPREQETNEEEGAGSSESSVNPSLERLAVALKA